MAEATTITNNLYTDLGASIVLSGSTAGRKQILPLATVTQTDHALFAVTLTIGANKGFWLTDTSLVQTNTQANTRLVVSSGATLSLDGNQFSSACSLQGIVVDLAAASSQLVSGLNAKVQVASLNSATIKGAGSVQISKLMQVCQ